MMSRLKEIDSIRRGLQRYAQYLKEMGVVETSRIPGCRPGQGPDTSKGLAEAEAEVAACTKCPLHRVRTMTVFGAGDPNAALMFIGEGPGREEDRQGKPFVGRAGGILTRMIAFIGLSRERIYIANIVKCRPPDNREPTPEESKACRPHLERQIRLIRPRLLCLLGGVAARAFFGEGTSITRIRGQVLEYQGTPVVPTFHPAYLLRNPAEKKKAAEDLLLIKGLINRPRKPD